jgi:hypothetical protein
MAGASKKGYKSSHPSSGSFFFRFLKAFAAGRAMVPTPKKAMTEEKIFPPR